MGWPFDDLPEPGDDVGLGDSVNAIGALVDRWFKSFGPLQDWSAETLKGVASGDDSLYRRMLSPVIGSLNNQLPQTLRQLSDNLSGGSLAEAKTRAINAKDLSIGKAGGELQNSLLNTAMNTGLGAMGQMTGPLGIAGQLRASAKAGKKK